MKDDLKKCLYESFIAHLKTGLSEIYFEKKAYENPGYSRSAVASCATRVSKTFEPKERSALNEMFTKKCGGDAKKLLDVFSRDISAMPEEKAFDLMEERLIKKMGREIPDTKAQRPLYQEYRKDNWPEIISQRLLEEIVRLGPGGNDLDSHLTIKYKGWENLIRVLGGKVQDQLCRLRTHDHELARA